jgi:hypothetical protein
MTTAIIDTDFSGSAMLKKIERNKHGGVSKTNALTMLSSILIIVSVLYLIFIL